MTRQEKLELLTRAAKRAGLLADGWHRDGGLAVWSGHKWVNWDPLTDDGDSAKLRRALRIVVQWFPTDVAAMHWAGDGRGRSWAEPYGDDPGAAERRAVVRAAAGIGFTQLSHTEPDDSPKPA